MRQSADVYPVVNVLHLLGLVMLLGAIGIVDLRLMGAWRSLPAEALSRALTPVAVAGLFLLALTGPLLFAADAVALTGSSLFLWKLALIALALGNAAVFRLRRRPRGAGVAIAAFASLALWLSVAALGRLIAYY